MSPPLPVGPDYGFGLYIHWPYCSKICPYCDFNVYAAKDRDNSALVQALSDDLARHASTLQRRHPKLGSIYFGGGTPSLMQPADIERLIAEASRHFGLEPNVEITLEANPNDVLSNDVAAWVSAGINRLSIGLQSLNDEVLRFLGREHDAAEGRRAVEIAGRLVPNHSIDLIYARPGQSMADWETELTDALALGAPHLSLYELTIKDRTAFGKRAERGELTPMSDDDQADLYELTTAITDAHGLPAYEISNHARSPETQSRHNLIYWRSGDWIGLGPGAHGRVTLSGQRFATAAPLKPGEYTAMDFEASLLSGFSMDRSDSARELLIMGLRPVEGFDTGRFAALARAPLRADKINELAANGFLTQTAERIALTPAGRLLADRIAAELSP
ncbi:MAG: radical SAM family heme chaperone HemW [Henriciella sp.]